MLKMQPGMKEARKINLFHVHLGNEALQTFRNKNATNKRTAENLLIVFRRKNIKLESRATAKHKWHMLTSNAKTKSLPEFLTKINDYAERALLDNAQQMIESFLYAKMPPHLKRSNNLAYHENGTFDQIVAHLERELELSAMESDEKRPIPTMTKTVARDNKKVHPVVKADQCVQYVDNRGIAAKYPQQLWHMSRRYSTSNFLGMVSPVKLYIWDFSGKNQTKSTKIAFHMRAMVVSFLI